MLVFASDLARLQDAEQHVGMAEWRVLCQLEHLEQLRSDGMSTRAAEALLEVLKLGRGAWEARRSEILGRMRPVPTLDPAT